MAATVARSFLIARSTGTTVALLQKRLLSSTVYKLPPLPGFRHPISTTRYATPALSHSLRAIYPARAIPVRCRVNRSGPAYSPLNSGSNVNDRPPTEMAPLFPGCDYEHWLIVMDKPGGEGATKQQMIDCYVQTLARVLGSEEEAKKKIYNVSCERYFGFGCEIDEETSNKLEDVATCVETYVDEFRDCRHCGAGLPGVLFVLPDSYVDAEYKDYGDGLKTQLAVMSTEIT